MTIPVRAATIDVDVVELRHQVQSKYTQVANTPELGFHFHIGRPVAEMLGYDDELVDSLPEGTVASFAGTGNPFSMGDIRPGETVLDIGCGAGFDSLIAARMTGPSGKVIGIDMTPAMLEKAKAGAEELGLTSTEFRECLAESLPVEDGTIDVVISNGVINLCPDKLTVFNEVHRVLKPGGRIQIADIVVRKEISQDSREDIDLWAS
jgi:SAM-dependent methyltransferase